MNRTFSTPPQSPAMEADSAERGTISFHRHVTCARRVNKAHHQTVTSNGVGICRHVRAHAQHSVAIDDKHRTNIFFVRDTNEDVASEEVKWLRNLRARNLANSKILSRLQTLSKTAAREDFVTTSSTLTREKDETTPARETKSMRRHQSQTDEPLRRIYQRRATLECRTREPRTHTHTNTYANTHLFSCFHFKNLTPNFSCDELFYAFRPVTNC